jgi:hypothetical protein
MDATDSAPIAPLGGAKFVALQFAAIALVAGLLAWRIPAHPQAPSLPPLHNQPLAVEPLYDYPTVVTDEQLHRVLARLRPQLAGKQTKIGGVDHALRFWTNRAFFDDAKFASGEKLRRILTDQRAFSVLYGEEERPLLMPQKQGVRVRTQDGAATSTHVDHTMACLAEVGTPLDFEITVATGPNSVRTVPFRAIVEQSLRDFTLNQVEYEWSGLTYALYMSPVREWTTKEGQRVSFDILARRMMREKLPRGVCFGNHRLFTLAAFLRIDDDQHILSPDVRQEVLTFLTAQTAVLVKNQSPEGYWGFDWARAEGEPEIETDKTGDLVSDRMLATGHALEWWAIAPEQCLPPRETLARAGQWLVKAIDESTDEQIQSRFTYLSHAGRALALWRKVDPGKFKL